MSTQPEQDHGFDRTASHMAGEYVNTAQQEPVDLERIYETIIQWDENGGKRSSRELAYLIHALYTAPSISEPLGNQKPMFWYRPLRDGMYEGPIHNNSIGGKMYRDEAPNEWKPLYTAPISEPVKERISEPVNNLEPVAWANPTDLDNFDMKVRTCGSPLHTVPLYTAPPRKEWVGLTDDDVAEVERWVEFKEAGSGQIVIGKLVRYIELKLRSKNNAV